MKRIVAATLFLLLAAGLAFGEDYTDYAKLEQLRQEFEARWESWRGPAFEAARQATTGSYGEINADPNRELMGIDESGNPIIYYLDNANAALSTRTNRIMPGGVSGYDLNGSTIVRLYHWDSSTANPGHQEFTGRIVNMDGSGHNEIHANHTAGTMIASGVQAAARGMATGATLYDYDWNNDEAEMSTAGAAGAKVSSHSYHSGAGYGQYSSRARSYDLVANAAPYYLICISAGNDGPGWDTINSSNAAKNAMVVGAVNDVPNYTGPGSVSIASFSSLGPCDDDRIKPDIVGNGVDLYSCSVSSYTTLSGTSMSTPNIAGSAFLLYEQYHQTHNNSYPFASTIKGVIIHTANECGGWNGPDYRYGWGLMDSEAAATLIEYDGVTDDTAISEHFLSNGQTFTQALNVPGDEALRVTICWNDPAASTNAAHALINDLDLRVTQVGPNTTTMPWVLNGLTNTPASHGDNTQDNVEQVWIQNPDPGAYLIAVSHKGNLQGASQAFSLIISGGTAGELPEATLTLTPVYNYIPPNGGPLTYTVDFSYNGANPRPGSSYWVDVTLPNGNPYGPIFQYNTTLMPGMQVSTDLTHQVPGYAPAGTYMIIGKVGTYPGTVIVSDQFEMVKLGNAPGGPGGSWPESDPRIASTDSGSDLPVRYAVSAAYPNPFNPSTSFTLQLPAAAEVNLAVYNVNGRLVETIAEGHYAAGSHAFSFDGSNLAAGVYFLHATVPGQLDEMRKLALVK